MDQHHYSAIILAAGSGKRMKSNVPKQYMLLGGKPLLYYSLRAFEKSIVSSIILVTGAGDEEFCKKEIVDRYGIQKVKAVVPGGRERYHSVYAGLLAAEETDYVLIHDGARPFVDQDVIKRSIETVEKYNACVVGVRAKDTIKIVNSENTVVETPNRNYIWQIQTPQTFSYSVICEAYRKMQQCGDACVTDDAMVVEQMTEHQIKVVEGSYQNIKITTPEDLIIAETYAKGFIL